MKAIDTLHAPPEHTAEFFKLNNTYVIPGGSRLNDLLNDALAFLDAGIDVFDGGDELDGFRGGWSGLHSLQQARAVFRQIYERVYDRAASAGPAGDEGSETS